MVKKIMFISVMVFAGCQLGSCQMAPAYPQEKQNLVVNIDDYMQLFEENNVEAKLTEEDGEDYLEITFQDGTVARFKDQLVDVQKIEDKVMDEINYTALLRIRIIEDNTATVFVESTTKDGDPGECTAVDYTLPDFEEVVSFGWEPETYDLDIKRWFPREEIVAVYSQAKSMEELIKQYNEEQ